MHKKIYKNTQLWNLVCLKPSNGDKYVEDTDHEASLSPCKEVSDDGRSNGGVAGLSNTDHASQQHQKPEELKRSR